MMTQEALKSGQVLKANSVLLIKKGT